MQFCQRLEYGAEHRRGQDAGVGVVARAVIAVVQRDGAAFKLQIVTCAMAKWRS